MTKTPRACAEIEHDLIAMASGEAEAMTAPRVEAHTALCPPCAREFERYRALNGVLADWGREPGPTGALARQRLGSRLADLRRRLLIGRVVGRLWVSLNSRA